MFRFWNNRMFLQIAVLFFIAQVIVSCVPNGKNAETSITSFETLKTDTVVPLFASYEKPSCHLTLSFEAPIECSNKDALEAANEMIISLSENGSLSGGDLKEMVKEYTKAYIMDYMEEGKDAIANYGDDMEATATWMSYEENCTGETKYNANGFFSYAVSLYSFTGGAHGNNSVKVGSLDLNTATRLGLASLFTDEKLPQVRSLLLQNLTKEQNCATTEELTEKGDFFDIDQIDVTENFYIDDNGVNFLYDPFEIAPYSTGEITITISWQDLLPYLREDSPVLVLAKK